MPGHHEGDLLMDSVASNWAIGTIVECTTGYLTLVHLPDGHTAVQVRITHARLAQYDRRAAHVGLMDAGSGHR